jgi:Ca2+-binding RTX toxin-like protein
VGVGWPGSLPWWSVRLIGIWRPDWEGRRIMRLRVVLVLGVLAVAALPGAAGSAVVMCGSQLATIVGTNDRDVITGTDGPDVIQGLGGNDTIYGGGGDDLICGGDGDDLINGGDGNDTLLGGEGNDNLFGADGNDVLNPGEGAENLMGGGDGNDYFWLERVEPGDLQGVNGGPGRDTLDLRYVSVPGDQAGVRVLLGLSQHNLLRGNCPPPGWHCWASVSPSGSVQEIEVVYGTQGNDYLQGNDLRNTLYGLGGHDYLQGGGGRDRLVGGAGGDRLEGGAGNDLLRGGAGTDLLDGGGGVDDCQGGETTLNCE